MKFIRLGNSGLSVSRLCLGCMSYGDTTKGWHGDWLLDEEASRPFFRQALEAGINFFDTANGYSGGTSEEITGKRPVGIRTPSFDFSPHTLSITREMGLLYDSSMMADDEPYELVENGEPVDIVVAASG